MSIHTNTTRTTRKPVAVSHTVLNEPMEGTNANEAGVSPGLVRKTRDARASRTDYFSMPFMSKAANVFPPIVIVPLPLPSVIVNSLEMLLSVYNAPRENVIVAL